VFIPWGAGRLLKGVEAVFVEALPDSVYTGLYLALTSYNHRFNSTLRTFHFFSCLN